MVVGDAGQDVEWGDRMERIGGLLVASYVRLSRVWEHGSPQFFFFNNQVGMVDFVFHASIIRATHDCKLWGTITWNDCFSIAWR